MLPPGAGTAILITRTPGGTLAAGLPGEPSPAAPAKSWPRRRLRQQGVRRPAGKLGF